MAFKNREEAGLLLSKRLASYRGRHPLVLAIPRGALPVAQVIANELQGELDVVLVHKLGAPGNPELAIGAVDESGKISLDETADYLGVEDDYIRQEAFAQLTRLRQRRKAWTPLRPPIDPAGRVVIVVDDGVATGATMMAALSFLRKKEPERLIAAAAVAPPETVVMLGREADEVVVLDQPLQFEGVGAYFLDFAQVSDAEVSRVLSGAVAG